jgi:hypothetical protein
MKNKNFLRFIILISVLIHSCSKEEKPAVEPTEPALFYTTEVEGSKINSLPQVQTATRNDSSFFLLTNTDGRGQLPGSFVGKYTINLFFRKKGVDPIGSYEFVKLSSPYYNPEYNSLIDSTMSFHVISGTARIDTIFLQNTMTVATGTMALKFRKPTNTEVNATIRFRVETKKY